MITELERAVEKAVAIPRWPEVWDTESRPVHCICLLYFSALKHPCCILNSTYPKKGCFTGTFQPIINPIILHNSQL
jgi:hypothetical protein